MFYFKTQQRNPNVFNYKPLQKKEKKNKAQNKLSMIKFEVMRYLIKYLFISSINTIREKFNLFTTTKTIETKWSMFYCWF